METESLSLGGGVGVGDAVTYDLITVPVSLEEVHSLPQEYQYQLLSESMTLQAGTEDDEAEVTTPHSGQGQGQVVEIELDVDLSTSTTTNTNNTNGDVDILRHSCDKCPSSFKSRTGLLRHMITHVPGGGGGAFPCTYTDCQSSFSREDDLRRHIISLHEPYIFPCPHCDKKFKRKDHIRRHARNIHKKELAKVVSIFSSPEGEGEDNKGDKDKEPPKKKQKVTPLTPTATATPTPNPAQLIVLDPAKEQEVSNGNGNFTVVPASILVAGKVTQGSITIDKTGGRVLLREIPKGRVLSTQAQAVAPPPPSPSKRGSVPKVKISPEKMKKAPKETKKEENATATPTTPTVHPCRHCSQSYTRRYRLHQHLLKVHGERVGRAANRDTNSTPEERKCPHCDYVAPRMDVLRRHVTSTHPSTDNTNGNGDEANNVCQICFAVFGSSYLLKRHTASVHPSPGEAERPWKCHSCSKTFKRKDQLGDHIKAHCPFLKEALQTLSSLAPTTPPEEEEEEREESDLLGTPQKEISLGMLSNKTDLVTIDLSSLQDISGPLMLPMPMDDHDLPSYSLTELSTSSPWGVDLGGVGITLNGCDPSLIMPPYLGGLGLDHALSSSPSTNKELHFVEDNKTLSSSAVFQLDFSKF